MRIFSKVMLSIFIIITFVACSSSEEGQSDEDQTTRTIKHELGETTVKENPETVVVFDYGVLDTLDELDIEVAGVSKQTLPPYLEQYKDERYENIGSLKEPDFDKLANLNPDLILISGRQADQYDELSKLGPTVHLAIDHNHYLDSFKENMEIIGEIFNKEDKVSEKIVEIDEEIEKVQQKANENKDEALIVLANDDKLSAYGPNSRFGFIHDVLGVQPVDEDIEASIHGMNISSEYVAEKNPDILYVIDRGAAIGEDSAAKDVVENKLIERTKAYKNDKIVYLDPYNWYLSGGGLQSVPKMIKEIDESF